METCKGCGTQEGNMHVFGCDLEICPFCEGQLKTCNCSYGYGLQEGDEDHRREILEVYGRIPYIEYPRVCAKCGGLNPPDFKLPYGEWERYIQPDKRDSVLCRECYEYIKRVIDAGCHRHGRGPC